MPDSPTLKIKKLFNDAIVPFRAHPTDSGLDLYIYNFLKYYEPMDNRDPGMCNPNHNKVRMIPGSRVLVNTGISATVGKGYEIQIRPRSGLALKAGLTVLNSPGTIDEQYRGMIGVIVVNHTSTYVELEKGMKIAQMVVCPVMLCNVEVVDDLDSTDRDAGGFGSTGN